MKFKVYKIEPILNVAVRGLCAKPYHGHKKGCPNYGKKQLCPPHAPLLPDIFDISKPIYLIYNKFDFKKHKKNLKKQWPKATQKQLECCLYWQGTARKQLKQKTAIFLKKKPEYYILTIPEACGVNITATMKKIGIELEWPPVNFTYQVALAGILKKG